MTVEDPRAGVNPDAEFVNTGTGLGGLPNLTQPNVIEILKAKKFPAGNVWKNPGGVLKQGWAMVMSAISGAATNAVNALTQIGTLIWKVGGSIIDDVGDFINAAVANANTAITNAGHAIGQLGSLIAKVGGSIIDDVGDFINAAKANAQTALTNAANVLANLQSTWNSIVNNWFGWTNGGNGDWTSNDADTAFANQAATIAALSTALSDLQNRAQNAAVGGVSIFIDFTLRPAASSLGSDFTQTYSGSGTGYLGLDNGAKWISALDSPRDCDFFKNDFQTTTDYQKIGMAFGSTPGYDALGRKANNEIHGRKNLAGDTYVYAKMEYNTAEIGCQVAGSRTVFATKTSGFSFKSNAIYWLECGTIAGLRVFRLLENNTPVLVATEVGTTSQVGASYRRTGGRVHAYAQPQWSLSPGRFPAMAISDNQPGTVTGSGGHMYRTTTSNVNASSGANLFPANFFNNQGASSGDVQCDLPTGTFTISEDGYYLIEAQVQQPGGSTTVGSTAGSGWPAISLQAWINGSPDRILGPPSVARVASVNTTGNTVNFSFPIAVSGSAVLWLQAGDDVQLGYNAVSSRSGAFTGDSGGLQTNFTITRVGAKNA